MAARGSGNIIRAEDLLDLNGANRSAKSYAFLYAMFKKTEVSKAPVRDALDCLLPFIGAYLGQNVGKQVDVIKTQEFLQSKFGFDIPLYAIEDLFPSLVNRGLAVFNKTTKRYIAKEPPESFEAAKVEIGSEFDHISDELTYYAKRLGFDISPPSGTWGDALLNFLRGNRIEIQTPFTNIKGVIVDPAKIEISTVGAFIRSLHSGSPELFAMVLNVYMGVLIEDFISSVAEIGQIDPKYKVTVFYDTAVLMRLIGTSSRILSIATEELTRYLQDIGFSTMYSSGNEAEVANILNTIIYVKDTGREIEGETAEAISLGEVSISDLRMLQNTFNEQLARKNVFVADQLENFSEKDSAYQIDQKKFESYLLARATERKKPYGQQNRENDASYLGNVMRLRRGIRTRDLAHSKYIFITSNKFLAYSAKRFLIEERMLSAQNCPPILTVGQAATIAWLLKDQTIAPEKAGRELLSNCFAAIRPDAEWFRYFKEGVEKAVGSIDDFMATGNNSITLQATRRIAQEESFGNSMLVRELNMAEILQAAKNEEEAIIAQAAANKTELEQTMLKQRQEAEQNTILAQDIAAALSREQAFKELRAQEAEDARRRTYKIARSIINLSRWLAVIAFCFITFLVWISQGESGISAQTWICSAILSLLTIVGFLDLIGVPLAKNLISKLEQNLATKIYELFYTAPDADARD